MIRCCRVSPKRWCQLSTQVAWLRVRAEWHVYSLHAAAAGSDVTVREAFTYSLTGARRETSKFHTFDGLLSFCYPKVAIKICALQRDAMPDVQEFEALACERV